MKSLHSVSLLSSIAEKIGDRVLPLIGENNNNISIINNMLTISVNDMFTITIMDTHECLELNIEIHVDELYFYKDNLCKWLIRSCMCGISDGCIGLTHPEKVFYSSDSISLRHLQYYLLGHEGVVISNIAKILNYNNSGKYLADKLYYNNRSLVTETITDAPVGLIVRYNLFHNLNLDNKYGFVPQLLELAKISIGTQMFILKDILRNYEVEEELLLNNLGMGKRFPMPKEKYIITDIINVQSAKFTDTILQFHVADIDTIKYILLNSNAIEKLSQYDKLEKYIQYMENDEDIIRVISLYPNLQYILIIDNINIFKDHIHNILRYNRKISSTFIYKYIFRYIDDITYNKYLMDKLSLRLLNRLTMIVTIKYIFNDQLRYMYLKRINDEKANREER